MNDESCYMKQKPEESMDTFFTPANTKQAPQKYCVNLKTHPQSMQLEKNISHFCRFITHAYTPLADEAVSTTEQWVK